MIQPSLPFFLIILIMQLHRTLERRGVTTSFLILTCALTLQTCNFEFAAFFCGCEKNAALLCASWGKYEMHQSLVFANQFACVYYLFLHTLATIHLALLCGVETVIH